MAGNGEAEAFAKKICAVVSNGYLSLGLGIGLELGLFKAMTIIDKAATSAEIADMAKCKERPVREWLHQMAVGEVVEVDENGSLFYLPAHNRGAVHGFHGVFASFIPYLVHSHSKVLSAFRQDGPSGLDIEDSRLFMDYFQRIRPATLDEFVPHAFRLVDGLQERLVSGIKVCDVGTSKGHLTHWIASKYINSHVTGVDTNKEYVDEAKGKAAEMDLRNTSFKQGDAHDLPGEWSEKFDFVVMFYVLHDLEDATQAVAEVYRILKKDGVFFLVEVDSHDNPKENVGDPLLSRPLAVSYYYCTTTLMSAIGNEALGTCPGREKLKSIVQSGGFDLELKGKCLEFQRNFIIICQK